MRTPLLCIAAISSNLEGKQAMKQFLLGFSVFTFLVGASFGSVVEFKGDVTNIDVSGTPMKVYPQATLTTLNGTSNLKLTGYGIRQKSVAFVKVNVYLATSYVDEGTTLSNSPIDSLKDAKGRVIVLDMLRTMNAQDIRSAFEEALDVNGVDVNAKAIQSVFSKFEGDLYAGDRILLASYPGERNAETLMIELPKSNISEVGNFLGLDFWKIWFGEPVDELMGELKAKLSGAKKP
jgi:hypothetical protein